MKVSIKEREKIHSLGFSVVLMFPSIHKKKEALIL